MAFSHGRSTFALQAVAAMARCACHSPACPSWSSTPRAVGSTAAGSARKNREREPASGSVPLRVLHIYALVSASGPAPTPLHMPAVRLVVTAPPEDWAWGRPPEDWSAYNGGARSTAWPTQGVDSRGAHFRYNDAESRAIWYRARSYCGNPSEEFV